MTICNIVIFCLLLLLSSCSELEDPDLINKDDVLKLSVEGKSSLANDGRDQTKIVARIPKEAGSIDISFKTTAGTFTYSASKEIKVFADSIDLNYRYASTLIKSDSTTGNVYITAETPQVRRILSLTFIK